MSRVLHALVILAGATSLAVAQGEPNPAQRDSLEARVRSRMAQVMRTQLGLNDEPSLRGAASRTL